MSRLKPIEPGAEALLIEILRGTALLSGAACAGHWALFDPAHARETPENTADRHHRAAELCHTCPVLDSCAEWAENNPAAGAVLAATTPKPRNRLDKAS